MSLSFSISVPVGNWHPFLPACLESLAAQDAPVKASLLDASGDPRVSDVANRFAGFLHYRRHGPDSGQSAAIVEGWAKTPGDILGWLNADDILMPGALAEARAAFASEPGLDMTCGHSAIIDEKQRMTGYQWTVEPPGPRILEANIISQPSCFFKRVAYEAAGGLDESLHYTMDWDLWIRLHENGARAAFIDAPLSMVMWGEGTKTAAFNKARREELRRIIEIHAPPEKRRKIFRAFAIHNLMSRANLSALTRAIERGRSSVFGLGADGAIAPGAKLYLAHYESAPKAGVSIALSGGAEKLGVRSSEAAQTRIASASEVYVAFERPLEGGRQAILTLEPEAGARLRFRFAAWG
jgi:GT2 family glycosyltransferase